MRSRSRRRSSTGSRDPIVNSDRDLGRNGTFLAIRQLEQNVDGFWRYCEEAAAALKQQLTRTVNITPEFVGAKLVGRWPDGSSLVRFPYHAGSEDGQDRPLSRTGQGTAEAPAIAMSLPAPPLPQMQRAVVPVLPKRVEVKRTDAPVREVSVTPDNDFLFGAEDPQGLRCPFGAHIRRANPRESQEPGSSEQLAITNRHRILRVGRRYQPDAGRNQGLFFMCLNADIERQFEFIQQTWLQAPSFHGLMDERDPIVGSRHPGAPRSDDGYTIPTGEKPVRLQVDAGFRQDDRRRLFLRAGPLRTAIPREYEDVGLGVVAGFSRTGTSPPEGGHYSADRFVPGGLAARAR